MTVDQLPADWTLIQFHPDPNSRRYRTSSTAARACMWLNANAGPHDIWLYRPGPTGPDGYVRLERRWVGRWEGLT